MIKLFKFKNQAIKLLSNLSIKMCGNNLNYHAVLLGDGVIVVERIVNHAVLVVKWLPVPDGQHLDHEQPTNGSQVGADEV